MLTAPNLARFEWLSHGFGLRDSVYPPGIATLKQIHSSVVRAAETPAGDRFAEGDALVTNTKGLLVGVRTADCVPILIVDARTRAVAAVHAGWRGSADKIAAAAVRELITRFGGRTEDLHAAVGPAIGPCCYEVGSDVASRFGIEVPERTRLDLPVINGEQLHNAGVADVWIASECTFCLPGKYFSFRREKDQAGRMMSFIGARNP